MEDFPQALPHGTFEVVFPDVFFLRGQSKVPRPDQMICTTRAMTVIKDGEALTLVNSIRLDQNGLEALDRLGQVNTVARIGGNHGRDDAFYADRYGVPVWAPKGVTFNCAPSNVVELTETNHPLSAADVMLFSSTLVPEAVIRLHAHGGVLITGDCFQNIAEPDEFVDAPSARFLEKLGFFKPANIEPIWKQNMNPDLCDFDRILATDFQHLLPGHGKPIINDAHKKLRKTVKRLRDMES